jgi:anti-sigma regulatory factor (Ser/Thr protein kinase)
VTAPRSSNHKGREGDPRCLLAKFSVPSEPGNERRATEEVAGAVEGLGLPGPRLERLKTAVAEATMNAMEHGNEYRPEVPVELEVLSSGADLSVRITDRGGGSPVPDPGAEAPDLEAKLEGLQTPRGWGLFLIKNMVDEMRVTSDGAHHTVELVMYLEGGGDAR